MILVMIAVILVFVIITIALPDREVTEENANLTVVSDTDVPIGSIGVSFNTWEGSLSSGAGMNADGSMLRRGDSLSFEVDTWPATVYIYADQQGSRILATAVIESAPENGRWIAAVTGSAGELAVSVQ